jgi:hypothetical protein
MNDFLKGIITGVAGVLVLVLVVLALRFFNNRGRKILEYMESQSELQGMQEDIGNRPPDEFLEDPGVRGAADNAADEFRRKRDEAIQRRGNRHGRMVGVLGVYHFWGRAYRRRGSGQGLYLA